MPRSPADCSIDYHDALPGLEIQNRWMFKPALLIGINQFIYDRAPHGLSFPRSDPWISDYYSTLLILHG